MIAIKKNFNELTCMSITKLLGQGVLLSLHRESEQWVSRGCFLTLFNYLNWDSAHGLFCSARLCPANENTDSFVLF